MTVVCHLVDKCFSDGFEIKDVAHSHMSFEMHIKAYEVDVKHSEGNLEKDKGNKFYFKASKLYDRKDDNWKVAKCYNRLIPTQYLISRICNIDVFLLERTNKEHLGIFNLTEKNVFAITPCKNN